MNVSTARCGDLWRYQNEHSSIAFPERAQYNAWNWNMSHPIRRVSGNDFDTGVRSGCSARDPDNTMAQVKKRWLGRKLVRCLPTCERAKDVVRRMS